MIFFKSFFFVLLNFIHLGCLFAFPVNHWGDNSDEDPPNCNMEVFRNSGSLAPPTAEEKQEKSDAIDLEK